MKICDWLGTVEDMKKCFMLRMALDIAFLRRIWTILQVWHRTMLPVLLEFLLH